jgi:hypothetical protein
MELRIKRDYGVGFCFWYMNGSAVAPSQMIDDKIVFYDDKEEICVSLHFEFSQRISIEIPDSVKTIHCHRVKKNYGVPYILKEVGKDPVLYVPLSMVEVKMMGETREKSANLIFHYKTYAFKCRMFTDETPINHNFTDNCGWGYVDGFYTSKECYKVDKSNTYKKREALLAEINSVCGISLSDYQLKSILEHYVIKRKK